MSWDDFFFFSYFLIHCFPLFSAVSLNCATAQSGATVSTSPKQPHTSTSTDAQWTGKAKRKKTRNSKKKREHACAIERAVTNQTTLRQGLSLPSFSAHIRTHSDKIGRTLAAAAAEVAEAAAEAAAATDDDENERTCDRPKTKRKTKKE